MAVKAITVTLGNALPNNEFNVSTSNAADPVAAIATSKTNSTAVVAAAVPVAAALAVLVADGASPTQAHVTTLNSAYSTLAAAITASDTTVQALSLSANLTLLLDLAVLTSNNAIRAAVRAALQAAKNYGLVT